MKNHLISQAAYGVACAPLAFVKLPLSCSILMYDDDAYVTHNEVECSAIRTYMHCVTISQLRLAYPPTTGHNGVYTVDNLIVWYKI